MLKLNSGDDRFLEISEDKKHKYINRLDRDPHKNVRFDEKKRITFIGKYRGFEITARVYKESDVVIVEEGVLTFGEFILPYLGKSEKNGLCYRIFGSYSLNLKELKYAFDYPGTVDLGEIDITDASLSHNGRPGNWGIQILSDVLRGLDNLAELSLLHGDLNVRNIVLQLNRDNKVITKLTGLKQNPGEKANWKGQFEDYGNIIKFTLGVDSDGHYCIEARDLLNRIEYAPSRRFGWPLTPKQWRQLQRETHFCFSQRPICLLNHPLFWTSERCIIFICNVSIILGACKKYLEVHMERKALMESKGRKGIELPKYRSMRRFIRAVRRIYLGDSAVMKRQYAFKGYAMEAVNWQEVIKKRSRVLFNAEISPKVPINRIYINTGEDVSFLVKWISDLYTHHIKKDEEVQKVLGTDHDQFYEFFRTSFPHLLIQLYRVVQAHMEALEESLPNGVCMEALKKDVELMLGFD